VNWLIAGTVRAVQMAGKWAIGQARG